MLDEKLRVGKGDAMEGYIVGKREALFFPMSMIMHGYAYAYAMNVVWIFFIKISQNFIRTMHNQEQRFYTDIVETNKIEKKFRISKKLETFIRFWNWLLLS